MLPWLLLREESRAGRAEAEHVGQEITRLHGRLLPGGAVGRALQALLQELETQPQGLTLEEKVQV